jgi:N-hydroxyarylamine O-acetyltransferase
MNIEAYLKRIHYDGSRIPTLANLLELHRTHLLNVPFENLDIHLGRPIVLDEEKIIHKIVERRRGGFCYELNGAFALCF